MASHHITQDLANLSLYQPYDGTEEILIGDGSGLPLPILVQLLLLILLNL